MNPHADSVQQPSERYCEACERNVTGPCNDRICSTPEVAQWGAAAQPVPGGIGVYGDADHAAWLADKIVALGDYAKEAAQMLRRWPAAEPSQSGSAGEAADWVNEWSDKHEVPLDNRARAELVAALSRQAPAAPAKTEAEDQTVLSVAATLARAGETPKDALVMAKAAVAAISPQDRKPVAFDGYLCRAWGETEMACAEIVRDIEGIRRFMVREWINDESDSYLATVMAEIAAWDWNEEPWAATFEIGGVQVEKVYSFATPGEASGEDNHG